jgi:ketosteroid isomerase-like protein
MGVREEHIEMVKRAFELIEHREYDQLRPLLTDDAVWAGAITQAPVQGADQMIALMKRFDADVGMTTEIESADYFGDEHQVVAHEHVRLTRGDRTLQTESAHVFEFHDSKVSKVTVFTGDPQGMATLMQ